MKPTPQRCWPRRLSEGGPAPERDRAPATTGDATTIATAFATAFATGAGEGRGRFTLRLTQDFALGLSAALFGAALIYIAPIDSDSGLIEKVRGRFSVGDALAPSAAGVVILVAGLWVALSALWSLARAAGRAPEGAARGGLTLRNLAYLAALAAIFTAAFTLTRYAGPVAALAVGEDYRLLRDTVPWKYIGFVAGGGAMIFALISLAEGRMRARRLALAVAVAAGVALAYDLPFEDLLLPPNGDV